MVRSVRDRRVFADRRSCHIVHKYLDSDNSGTHPDCTTVSLSLSMCNFCFLIHIVQDNTAVLQTLVTFLQQNGNRQAILSETGGGNTASCETM